MGLTEGCTVGDLQATVFLEAADVFKCCASLANLHTAGRARGNDTAVPLQRCRAVPIWCSYKISITVAHTKLVMC